MMRVLLPGMQVRLPTRPEQALGFADVGNGDGRVARLDEAFEYKKVGEQPKHEQSEMANAGDEQAKGRCGRS